jgi:hypothetical protein
VPSVQLSPEQLWADFCGGRQSQEASWFELVRMADRPPVAAGPCWQLLRRWWIKFASLLRDVFLVRTLRWLDKINRSACRDVDIGRIVLDGVAMVRHEVAKTSLQISAALRSEAGTGLLASLAVSSANANGREPHPHLSACLADTRELLECQLVPADWAACPVLGMLGVLETELGAREQEDEESNVEARAGFSRMQQQLSAAVGDWCTQKDVQVNWDGGGRRAPGASLQRLFHYFCDDCEHELSVSIERLQQLELPPPAWVNWTIALEQQRSEAPNETSTEAAWDSGARYCLCILAHAWILEASLH